MVKIALSYDTDVDFIEKCKNLQLFLAREQRFPTFKSDKKLYKFISKLRMRHRNNPTLPFWEWRIPMMCAIGLDITAGATVSRAPSPSNIEPHWRTKLNQLRTATDNERRQQDLDWFDAISHVYRSKSGFLKQKRFTTLHELLIKWCQLGDIDPRECTRSQPTYDIRHTLPYIVTPLNHWESPPQLKPTWRLKDCTALRNLPSEWTAPLQCGNTVHFDASCFDTNLFQKALSRTEKAVGQDGRFHEG